MVHSWQLKSITAFPTTGKAVSIIGRVGSACTAADAGVRNQGSAAGASGGSAGTSLSSVAEDTHIFEVWLGLCHTRVG